MINDVEYRKDDRKLASFWEKGICMRIRSHLTVYVLGLVLGLSAWGHANANISSSLSQTAVSLVHSVSDRGAEQQQPVVGIYPIDESSVSLVAIPSEPLTGPISDTMRHPSLQGLATANEWNATDPSLPDQSHSPELETVDESLMASLPDELDDEQMNTFTNLCQRKDRCGSCSNKGSCGTCNHSCESCDGDSCGSNNCGSGDTCGTADTCGESSCNSCCCDCCEEIGEDYFATGLLTSGGGVGTGGTSGFVTSTGGSSGTGGSGTTGTGPGTDATTTTGPGPATDTTSTTGPGPGPAVGPTTTTGPGVLVPEPTTWLALGTMAGIAAYLKKRRDRQNSRSPH